MSLSLATSCPRVALTMSTEAWIGYLLLSCHSGLWRTSDYIIRAHSWARTKIAQPRQSKKPRFPQVMWSYFLVAPTSTTLNKIMLPDFFSSALESKPIALPMTSPHPPLCKQFPSICGEQPYNLSPNHAILTVKKERRCKQKPSWAYQGWRHPGSWVSNFRVERDKDIN